MANRYWVGGTGTWNTTSTTNWSASSGGASGASVPTAADSVFFDQATTYTVTMTGALACLDITVSAGTVTFATGTSPTLAVSGSMSLKTGTVWNSTGTITFNSTSTGKTVTTNGVTISGSVVFDGVGGGWTLGSALTLAFSRNVTVTNGTFNTGNYNVTAMSFNSSNSNTRTVTLGSSTITLSRDFNITTSTNLTFNANTSTITFIPTSASGDSSLSASGTTFYNVNCNHSTNLSNVHVTIGSTNATALTFNNFSINGNTTIGTKLVFLATDITVNGTFTASAGASAIYRTSVASDTIGTQRTITAAAVSSFTDIDFRDIAFAGACISGGNITGTRLGNCTRNSNITFAAGKTVYFRATGSANWGDANSWSATSGGTADVTQFPLAQDTAVFPAATYPASGSTVSLNGYYNIGTIDMSLRTSNTMTLFIAANNYEPDIYGDFTNGTGVSLTAPGGTDNRIYFVGNTTQNITSAGKTFFTGGSRTFTVECTGTVKLLDAFVSTSGNNSRLRQGTFDANGYNVTVVFFVAQTTNTRTLAIGSGTWTITGNGTSWNCSASTGLTVTGTGTISLTSTSSKTFAGGGIQTYPTINQGGAGTLTITGSNKFANITNTYSATGATTVLFTAGTTNEFTSFNLTGTVGKVCTLGSTTTSQAILSKPSDWLMGANSTNGGNNTGLSFTAGGGIDYLSVSYINGVSTAPPSISTGNFLGFFF